jgi:hypothetical protein
VCLGHKNTRTAKQSNRSICESTGSLDRQSAKTTLGGGGVRGDCGIGGGRSAWTRATRFSKCPTVLRSCA